MSKTVQQLIADARARVAEITVATLRDQLDAGTVRLLDVRERDEWAQGHIAGATLIPRGHLESRIERWEPHCPTPIVIACASGTRSLLAARTLQELGYTNVVSLAGGVEGWKNAGYPTVTPFAFTPEQRVRYSRHFLLPPVGEAGQARLLQSRVLLIGAGGLGSPAALYLAAAGVGTLGIVDADVVDRSNLQRQILHDETRLGLPKVESARQSLARLNPDVAVIAHHERLDRHNALGIIEGYDVVVNGSDNFPTRYLVSDACVLAGKPLVDGSIQQFDGQVTVYNYQGGPTYRTLFPVPPPPGEVPTCAEGGVLGVLAGVIGSLQALEAIKILLGVGDVLSGRLLLFDALAAEFREVRLRPRPDEPPITALVDYEAFCAGIRD